MTQFDMHDEGRPSWAIPILVGSLVSFLGHSVFTYASSGNEAVSLASCCCVIPVGFVPYAALTVLLALRRDPSLTPGQGFTVSFIAVGLGLAIWGGLTGMNADPVAIETVLRDSMHEQILSNPGSGLTLEEADELAASMASFAPYGALVVALVSALLAGVVGLMVVSFANGRRRRDLEREAFEREMRDRQSDDEHEG